MEPEAVRRVQTARTITALTHIDPDGDALGSLVGFCAMIPQATGFLDARASSLIRLAAEGTAVQWFHPERPPAAIAAAECVVILDCATPERTGLPPDLLAQIEPRTIMIDHHPSDRPFGLRYCRLDAPSASVVVYDLFRRRATPEAASWLYYGLLCDTLGFRVAHLTPAAYRVAAELLDAGADHDEAVRRAFRLGDLGLQRNVAAVLMNHLEEVAPGAVLLRLPPFMEASVGYAALRLVQDARDVRMAVLLSVAPAPDGGPATVRASVRTRPPLSAQEFAAAYGGGGHRHAAGFRVVGDPHAMMADIAARVRAYAAVSR